LTLDKGRFPAPRPRPDLAAPRDGTRHHRRDRVSRRRQRRAKPVGLRCPHQRVPAAGSVLVIGILAYVFISILGWVEATADPPATSYVDANSIMLG